MKLRSSGIGVGIALALAVVLALLGRIDTGGVSLVSTSAAPAPGPLTPNDRGYVRVETKSGSTKCSINTELVACRTSGDNWPVKPNGQPYHTASVTANGEFHWVDADLGALEGLVTLDYQTYTAQGWTIIANSDGTKFTNDHTGHGMTVSAQSVTPF
jgi:hypothetical protein